jgi:2-amino-4-hydroxy-6-hydroxymethyldihydropteridine diphosphokinase
MARAFISVGSNIDPDTHVRQALALIAVRTHLAAISTVYLTDPLGRPEQHPYYNCVLELATDLPPLEVKRAILRPIEGKLGRVRTQDRYAPRTIDLDLIAYGDLVLNEDGLQLPDPEIIKRPFLALPMAELAPGWVLAGSNCRIEEVAAALSADRMRPLADYTRQLRQELLP